MSFLASLMLDLVTCLALTSWWVGILPHCLILWFDHVSCSGQLMLIDAIWTQMWTMLIYLSYMFYAPIFEQKEHVSDCLWPTEDRRLLQQIWLQLSDVDNSTLSDLKPWLSNQLTKKQEINVDSCMWLNLWLISDVALLDK